ncbi:MAG: hypothetical protein LC708_03500, partial [Actinobacteria bacterium]|nr:hypothetical protein [Actinomycetota bacterium]
AIPELMSTDEGTAEPRAARRRPGPDDAALAAALGSLLRLSPAESAALSPAARAAMSGPARPPRSAAAPPVTSPSIRPAGRLRPLAPVPVPSVPDSPDDDSFWGPSPIDVHPGGETVALEGSGFGGPLHDAGGGLPRLSDSDVPGQPVADGAVPSPAVPDDAAAFTALSPGEDVPDWYTTPVLSVDAPPRPTSTARAVLTIAGQWWAARRRELLPGLVVGSLVILAFVVVLLSGGKGAGTPRVSNRAVPIDPSTTIPGLFATAAATAEAAPPESDVSLDVDAPFDVDKAPVTTKPKASDGDDTPPPSRPKSPPATPPATPPPAITPTTTTPPDTTPTTPPDTTPDTTVPAPTPAEAAG